MIYIHLSICSWIELKARSTIDSPATLYSDDGLASSSDGYVMYSSSSDLKNECPARNTAWNDSAQTWVSQTLLHGALVAN